MALIPCRECSHTISTEATACPQCGAPPQAVTRVPVDAMAGPSRSEEETLHSDAYVSVTTSRVIIRGTTYALRNIASVRMTFMSPSLFMPIVMILVGSVVLLLSFQDFSQSMKSGFTQLAISAAIIGIGVFWLKSKKTLFHVSISSSSGEVNALSSYDRGYIEQIVQSINSAIVRYR
ncbi:DUF6232 family protein [Pseudoxanthomonas sp. 22568]|jgi:hypothetical protein|uniref:DUF6232 family protein n=1 Tax=Pseudoxanthomonas sp. 22568 TaxID=3453945 RepID=UPI003F84627D